MEQYTASNGITVTRDADGDIRIENPGWDRDGHVWRSNIEVLREFFRAEEDERLGRWRWPENPDYVVYPDGTSRRAVRESDGQSMSVSLHDRKAMTTYLDSYVGAARAFDAAHPEPKPWHNAKPGETWALTVNGVESAWAFRVHEWERVSDGYLLAAAPNSPAIDAGRRIWPSEESS